MKVFEILTEATVKHEFDTEYKKIVSTLSKKLPTHIQKMYTDYTLGTDINNLSEHDQLQTIYVYPTLYGYIQHPSELVTKFAIRRYGNNIRWLPKKGIPVTPELEQLAIRSNGRAIIQVPNATVEQQIDAVNRSVKSLFAIFRLNKKRRQATPFAVLLAAIKKNPYVTLRILISTGIVSKDVLTQGTDSRLNIMNKIIQLCLNKDTNCIGLLVDNNIPLPEDISLTHLSDKQLMKMCKRRGSYIRHIIAAGIKPSEELLLAACENEGYAIAYIVQAGIKPSEEVQLTACKKYGHAIPYLLKAKIKLSHDVIMTALDNAPDIILELAKAKIKITDDMMKKVFSKSSHLLNSMLLMGIKVSNDNILTAIKNYPYNLAVVAGQTNLEITNDMLDIVINSSSWNLFINVDVLNRLSPDNIKYLVRNKQFIYQSTIYDIFVKNVFKDNGVLMKRWLDYAEDIRDEERE